MNERIDSDGNEHDTESVAAAEVADQKEHECIDTLLDTRFGIIFLLGGRFADALSTITFVEKLGLDHEANPLLRNLMAEHGSINGNIIHTAGVMAIAIPTAFALNKLCEKCGLKRIKGGNFLVYMMYGLESYGIAIQNSIFMHLQ